ncbi:MAG: type II toxin-antitoxin system PemK/MazF family toxin [Alcanivoracaceae bacterium]|nr:type II toxin-antitoxin system PemK/MazF family toxin [Alcanivoracaceae bacterium]
MVNNIARFQVWLVELNPTQGGAVNKRKPCVIISPNELLSLATVVIIPMKTKGFKIASRVEVEFNGKNGLLLLDQIKTIDKTRLIKNLEI